MINSASHARDASRSSFYGRNRTARVAALTICGGLALVLSSCAFFQSLPDYQNEYVDASPPPEALKVSSGVLTKLDFFYSLNQQCTSLGMPEIVLAVAPQNGTFQARAGHDYPKFSADSNYHVCNSKLVPAAQFYYQSSAGFVGEDTTSVGLTFPDGAKRDVIYKITVQ